MCSGSLAVKPSWIKREQLLPVDVAVQGKKTPSPDGTVDYQKTIPREKMDWVVTTAASISLPSRFIMRMLPIKTELSYGRCSCAL